MLLGFLGVISGIENHRNSNTYNSQPGVGISILGPETKSQKAAPNHCTMWYFMCTICGFKRGPLDPIFVHVISKKGPYILYMLYKNFICW